MDVLFVGSVAVVAPDPAQSRDLYMESLGLPLAAGEGSDYWHSERLAGTKSFGIWPLSEASQACLGRSGQRIGPSHRPRSSSRWQAWRRLRPPPKNWRAGGSSSCTA